MLSGLNMANKTLIFSSGKREEKDGNVWAPVDVDQ